MRKKWTKGQISKLRKMWLEGVSAGEIAVSLKRTRNAVLGKLHRLGVKREQ